MVEGECSQKKILTGIKKEQEQLSYYSSYYYYWYLLLLVVLEASSTMKLAKRIKQTQSILSGVRSWY